MKKKVRFLRESPYHDWNVGDVLEWDQDRERYECDNWFYSDIIEQAVKCGDAEWVEEKPNLSEKFEVWKKEFWSTFAHVYESDDEIWVPTNLRDPDDHSMLRKERRPRLRLLRMMYQYVIEQYAKEVNGGWKHVIPKMGYPLYLDGGIVTLKIWFKDYDTEKQALIDLKPILDELAELQK